MKIALVRPPYSSLYQLIKTKTKERSVLPPTGLMYVASSLINAGHNVKIIDAEIDDLGLPQIMKEIVEFKPDVVGTGATTPDFGLANRILKRVKDASDETTTIIGGAHPTVLPTEVLSKNKHIDFVVRYEGEITTTELIDALENGKDVKNIKGISYRKKDGEIEHNPNRELVDVDEIPWPTRDLIDQKKYLYPSPGKGLCNMTTIQTSRGCPYRCAFCYRMFGHKVRFRTTKLVVDEIEHCVNNYNVKFIYFVDDTFTFNRRRTIELCDEILHRAIVVSWSCLTRADTLDTELLFKMKKAGCVKISMGVESGNQRILDDVKKGTTLQQYKAGYKLLKSFGFETRGSFILGLPYETRETIMQTINFAKELDLDRAFFHIFTPYPGTELYEKALSGQGLRLIEKNWREFKRWGNAVVELEKITREELIELQKEAMTKFYVRPKIILYHIKQFLRGQHSAFYYRPLWYAIKNFLHLD